jgi:colanic acid/amylovoran biosynthesis glycosyltransferase
MKIGYLLSQYPSPTHTFLRREIAALRAVGLSPIVVATQEPDRPAIEFSAEEAEAFAMTTYASPRQGIRLILSLLRLGLRQPLRVSKAVLAAPTVGRNLDEPWVKGFWRLLQAAGAAETFRATGITHFHAHFTTTVARLASRLSGLPWSATIHGPAEFESGQVSRLREKVNEAAFIVTISKYGQSQVVRLLDFGAWEKVELCHLGVSVSSYQARSVTKKSDVLELVCVARLASVKGHAVLLKAVQLLKLRGVRVRLRLVGDGPERSTLERLAKELDLGDAVAFLGNQSELAVGEILFSSDVFVLASFAEGIPVSLMEAMASGVACVATNVNGVPELIENGHTGLLVSPFDPDSMARAVERLAMDPDLKTAIEERARARVSRAFSLERNVEELATIFLRRISA